MSTQTFIVMTVVAAVSALSGCAVHGGNDIPIGVMTFNQPAPSPPPVVPPDTGGNPLPLPTAGFGPMPAGAQLAIMGGPSFTMASGSFPAPNTSFPVLAASLVANGKIASEPLTVEGLTGTSWGPEPSPISVTATVVSVADDGSMQIQLSVPSLNLVSAPVAFKQPLSPGAALDYVAIGPWGSRGNLIGNWTFSGPNGDATRAVQGVFGYETPAAAMPVSGTATYASPAGTVSNAGGGYVGGTIFTSNGDAVATLYGGNASLSVDFGTGQISGAIKNLVAFEENGDGWSVPWRDVSISASIAAGTNKFSGTTAAGPTSTPLGGYCHPCTLPVPVDLSSSATGSVKGAFYGPAAQNVGAVWTIGDSRIFALGSFGAAH